MAFCENWEEQILALYDELLDAEEAEKVHAHLEACESCRQEWESLLSMKEMLRAMPEPKLPEGFSEDFHARLLKEEEPKIHRRSFGKMNWRSYATIAAALLIFVAWRGLGDHVTQYPIEENPQTIERPYIENAKIQGADDVSSQDTSAGSAPEVEFSYKVTPKADDKTANRAVEEKKAAVDIPKEPIQEAAPPTDTTSAAEKGTEDAAYEKAEDQTEGVMMTALTEDSMAVADTYEEPQSASGGQRAMSRTLAPVTVYQAVLSQEKFDTLQATYPIHTVFGADEAYNGKLYAEADEALISTLSLSGEAVTIDVTNWENPEQFSGKTILLIEIR